MDEALIPGIEGINSTTVNNDNIATAFGSGTVDVFATPAMIALMEQTAIESIASFLPQGYASVGTEVNVTHIRASFIGTTVTCHSRLEKINGKELIFKVIVSDSTGIIGSGIHKRRIIDLERFMSRL